MSSHNLLLLFSAGSSSVGRSQCQSLHFLFPPLSTSPIVELSSLAPHHHRATAHLGACIIPKPRQRATRPLSYVHTHFIRSSSFRIVSISFDHVRKFRQPAIGLALTPPHLHLRLPVFYGTLGWKQSRHPKTVLSTPYPLSLCSPPRLLSRTAPIWVCRRCCSSPRSGTDFNWAPLPAPRSCSQKLIGTWPPAWPPQPQ